MSRLWLLGILFPALCIAGRSARAGAGIVVETFDGDRPGDASVLLDPVVSELGRRGYASGDRLAAEIQAHVSMAPGSLSATQAAAAQHAVDIAYERSVDGDYERALASAQQALGLYATATGQMAHEPALRALERRAFYIAARSAEVLGRGDDAFAIMAEAIRTFPDDQPSATEFDPRVGALHRRVRDELTRQGAGSIEIRCDDPTAVIFLDERFVGTGTVKIDQVAPGAYRVYTERSGRAGRVRVVDIAPGSAATVTVPATVDAALRTGPQLVALDTHGLDDRAIVTVAVRLARAVGAPRIVLLGVRPIEGRRAIAGLAIDVESQSKVLGAVQIEPVAPAATSVRALAALLTGDRTARGPGLIVMDALEPRAAVRPPLGARRKIALALGATALASLGVAGAFELSSRSTYAASKLEPDDARQENLYQSANRKYELAQGFAIGAGAVAVAATVLWFSHRPAETPEMQVSPAITPTEASLVITGRF